MTKKFIRDIGESSWLESKIGSFNSAIDFLSYSIYNTDDCQDVLSRTLSLAKSVWLNKKCFEKDDIPNFLNTFFVILNVLSNESHQINDPTKAAYLKCISEITFHLRHDFLSALYMMSKGLNGPLKTDADLTSYGITQTPDICIVDESSMVVNIIECSVSSSSEKTIFQKGGQGLEKYRNIKLRFEELGFNVKTELLMLDTTTKICSHDLESYLGKSLWEKYLQICNLVGSTGIFFDDPKIMSKMPNWIKFNFNVSCVNTLINQKDMSRMPVERKVRKRQIIVPKGFMSMFRTEKPFLIQYLEDCKKRDEINKKITLFYSGKKLSFVEQAKCPDILKWENIINDENFTLMVNHLNVSTKKGGRNKIETYKPGIHDPVILVDSIIYNKSQEEKILTTVKNVLWEDKLYLENEKEFLLPQFPDLASLENDVINQVIKMENSDRKYLVDNLNSESVAREGLENFKLQLDKLNSTRKKVSWVSQPFTFPIFDFSKALAGNHDVNEFMVKNKPEFSRHTPWISKIFGSILERKLKKSVKKYVNPSEYDKKRDLESKIMQNKLDFREKKETRFLDNIKELKKELKKENQRIFKIRESDKLESETATFSYSFSKNEIKEGMKFEYFNWEISGQKQADKIFDNDYGKLIDSDNYYDIINKFLLSKSDYPIRPIDDLFGLEDNQDNLFTRLNKETLNKYELLSRDIVGTNYFNSCDFSSRLCYSLSYLSQTTHNGNSIMVDNLGFKNILLFVRGGKKIHQTKTSRHYRLLLPFNDELWDFMTLGRDCHSLTRVNIDNNFYILTPWQTMHEKHLQRGLSLKMAMLNYCLVYKDRVLCDDRKLDRSSMFFSTLLALHGRRTTEATLHNLRYSLANCMGVCSSLKETIPDLALKCKDPFQMMLMRKISKNYLEYYNLASKGQLDMVKHIFTEGIISGDFALSMLIYSTFLMTKSPTSQNIDQSKNLESIMNKHDDFYKVDCVLDNDITDLQERYEFSKHEENEFKKYPGIVKDNFMYSAKMSYMVGRHLAEYFMNTGKTNDIAQKWDNEINKPWAQVANSSGMRYKGTSFFGQKGHYVVTEECMKMLTKCDIDDFTKMLENDDSFRNLKAYKNMNITYLTKIRTMDDSPQLVFHVVDKEQRGGGREIYVMDLETKTLQQPIENFIKELCRMIDNEFISVPSNERLSKIHSKLFESREDPKGDWLFATLDCKRWAPQSNTNKYIMFILGMAPCLPSSFIVYFLSFFEMYKRKTIHTSVRTYKTFSNNKRNEAYKSYFNYDKNLGSVYFEMPYSFIMGIFNYLSSMMHAANIMYSNYLVPIILKSRNMDPEFKANIIAHSDDSAGRIEAANRTILLLGFKLYEIILALCNHNFSIKKCNLSRVYFEFLSILYVRSKLVPLVGKFISNLEYEPSDKGFCMDMLSGISESIQLISMGSTFEESYLKKWLYCNFICDFYKVKRNVNLIPQIGGFPASHTFFDLALGSKGDLIRLFIKNKSRVLNQLFILSLSSTINDDLTIPTLVSRTNIPLKKDLREQKEKLGNFLEPFIKKLKDLFGEEQFQEIQGLLSMSSDKHILNSLLRYDKLYNESSYTSSLMYENKTRMISRAMLNVSQKCVKLFDNFYKPREVNVAVEDLMEQIDRGFCRVLDKIYIFKEDLVREKNEISVEMSAMYNKFMNKWSQFMTQMYMEPIDLINKFQHLNLDNKRYVNLQISSKPVTFIYRSNDSGITLDVRFNEIVMNEKYPRLNFALLPFKSPTSVFERLKSIYPNMDDENLYSLINKYTKKDIVEFKIYSQVKSGHNLVNEMRGYINLLLENQRYHNTLENVVYNVHVMEGSKRRFNDESFNDVMCKIKTINYITSLDSKLKDYIKAKPVKYKLKEINPFEWWAEDPELGYLINFFSQAHQCYKKCFENKRITIEDIENLNFIYTWIKPQAKVGQGWVGNNVLLLKINNWRFKFEIVKEYIQNVYCYECPLGFMTQEETHILNEVFMRFKFGKNLNLSSVSSNLSFGISHEGNSYGISKEKNLDRCFSTKIVNSKVYFDVYFHANNMTKRNRYPDDTYYEIWNEKRQNIRLYGPLDFFGFSQNVKDIITIDERMPKSQWSVLIDSMVDLGLYKKDLKTEDYVNDFNMLEIRNLTDDYMKKLETELKVDDFVDIYHESENNSEACGKIKDCFLSVINNYSIKSKGYNLKSSKLLDNLLRNMDVNPYSLPTDIRDIYIQRSYKIYMEGKMDDFCKDFQALIDSSINTNVVANFLTKWGKESVQYSLKMAKEKEIDALIPFDYISESSTLKYYIKTLKKLLEVFDEIYNLHFDDLCNQLSIKKGGVSKILKLNVYSRNRMVIRMLFKNSLNNEYDINGKNISAFYLFNIIDSIFENADLRHVFRNTVQYPEDLTEMPLVQNRDYDPILNKLLVTEDTKFQIKEFVASYLRVYGNGSNIKTFYDIDKEYAYYQLQGRFPENWIFNTNTMAKMSFKHSKFTVLDTKLNDITKDFIKNKKGKNTGESDLFIIDQDNPNVIYTIKQVGEDDEFYDDFMDVVYSPEDFDPEETELEFTKGNLRKAKLKYDHDEADGDIKINLVSINLFRADDLPLILVPGEITVLETSSVLNFDFYMKTNFCKIGYRKNVAPKSDFEGINMIYVFGDFDKNIQKSLDNVGIKILPINHKDFEEIMNYEQSYKKINGKYVIMDRNVMMQSMTFLSKTLTGEAKDDSHNTQKFASMLDQVDLNEMTSDQLTKVLSECNNLKTCDLLNLAIQKSKLDTNFKVYMKFLLSKPNSVKDWKEEFKKHYPVKSWADTQDIDMLEQLSKLLTQIDYTSIMMLKNRSVLIDILENRLGQFTELPESVHLGKTNFNVFGYSSDIYNEFKNMLGEDMNDLLKGEIRMSSSCFKTLRAFIMTMESNINILNEKNDKEFLGNDLYFYNFLQGIAKIVVIDDTRNNDQLRSFLINASETYVLSRGQYIKEKYPRKPLNRSIRDTRSTSYIEKFKKYMLG